MDGYIAIDKSLCTECGLCADECSLHNEINTGKTVKPGHPLCSKCYHCYAICPNGAIKIEGLIDGVASIPISPATDNYLLGLLAGRRSCRRYVQRDIDRTLLMQIIETARYIPSGGNRHSCEFTVLTKGNVRDQLYKELTRIYDTRRKLISNPIARTILKPFVSSSVRGFLSDQGYRTKMREIIERIYRGDDPLFYGAPAVIVIHSSVQIPTPKEDSVLAGYNISLMAETKGLGACFVSLAQNAINTSAKCKKILGLNVADTVHAVLLVGYPVPVYYRTAPRRTDKIYWS